MRPATLTNEFEYEDEDNDKDHNEDNNKHDTKYALDLLALRDVRSGATGDRHPRDMLR